MIEEKSLSYEESYREKPSCFGGVCGTVKKKRLYIKDIVYADNYFPTFERVLNTKA